MRLSEVSWVDWDRAREHWALFKFTQRVTKLRADHPVFRRRRFLHGDTPRDAGTSLPDVAWFVPNGNVMTDRDWSAGFAKSFGVFLNGLAIAEPDARGAQVIDDSFLLLFNAHHEPLPFTLPPEDFGGTWECVLDTAVAVVPDRPWLKAGSETMLEARTLVVLKRAS